MKTAKYPINYTLNYWNGQDWTSKEYSTLALAKRARNKLRKDGKLDKMHFITMNIVLEVD